VSAEIWHVISATVKGILDTTDSVYYTDDVRLGEGKIICE